MNNVSPDKLIVLLRAPRPGAVKTRLAAAIGPGLAAEAYTRLVEILLSQLAPDGTVELRYAPADAEDEVRHWLRPGWSLRPQSSGDLGRRMHSAFANAFSAGAQRVALIGSDCPGVTTADIEAAWAGLRDHDVVLGSASDGGYWLIALREPQPALFENMTWSTNTVLRETLDRASKASLRIRLLRELTDIDTERDWRAFQDAVNGGAGSNP